MLRNAKGTIYDGKADETTDVEPRFGRRRWPVGRLERERVRVGHAFDRLRLLGPAATLDRGYAIVQDAAGTVVTASDAVAAGQRIGVRLSQGRIAATVEEVTE